MEQEKIVIELKKRMAVLIVQPFDTDIDTESLLKIDYSNIVGEILTFPVAFNRIANLKADMANILAERKLDFEVFEANMYKDKKKDLINLGEKGTEKGIEMAMLRDPKYVAMKKRFLEVQRSYDYTESLYWSAQSKDTKLNRLSEKIRPEEFENEIVEGTINGIMIKMAKKVMK